MQLYKVLPLKRDGTPSYAADASPQAHQEDQKGELSNRAAWEQWDHSDPAAGRYVSLSAQATHQVTSETLLRNALATEYPNFPDLHKD